MIVHYRKILNAGQSYLNWDLTFLCQFLLPLKHNYSIFFNTSNKDWRNYSKEGTKIAVYKEVSYYLEFSNQHFVLCDIVSVIDYYFIWWIDRASLIWILRSLLIRISSVDKIDASKLLVILCGN